MALTMVQSSGSRSEVDILVNETEAGVYDIVPEAGFEAMSTYTLSFASPCGDSIRDEMSFDTAEIQAFPTFEGKRLESTVESAEFTHFDTVACVPLPENSRTATITAPDVETPWSDVVLYRWTVNGVPWVERSQEQTVRFSQSCESGWGSALWSGGQGSRFWAEPELAVTLELRLPGASSALWIDSIHVALDCATTETIPVGEESPSDTVLEPSSVPVSADSEDVTQLGPMEDAERSRGAANVEGCSMMIGATKQFEVWGLLSCALLARRRRRTLTDG
jgi:hypothetical protein